MKFRLQRALPECDLGARSRAAGWSRCGFRGTDPAALYRSDDRARRSAQWTRSSTSGASLLDAGIGGLCLHTILPDPRDPSGLWLVFRRPALSQRPMRRVVGRGAQRRGHDDDGPPNAPHFRPQCAHKMRYDAKNPSASICRIIPAFIRSDDGGDTWIDIAKGLPSGIRISAGRTSAPRDTRTCSALESETFSLPIEGATKSGATRDAGESWSARKGLPQHDAYFSVLRDAFHVRQP